MRSLRVRHSKFYIPTTGPRMREGGFSAQRDLTSRRGHATPREAGWGCASLCERVRDVSVPELARERGGLASTAATVISV